MKKQKENKNQQTINFTVLDEKGNSAIERVVEGYLLNQLKWYEPLIIADLHEQVYGMLSMKYNPLSAEEQIDMMIEDLIDYLNNIKQ